MTRSLHPQPTSLFNNHHQNQGLWYTSPPPHNLTKLPFTYSSNPNFHACHYKIETWSLFSQIMMMKKKEAISSHFQEGGVMNRPRRATSAPFRFNPIGHILNFFPFNFLFLFLGEWVSVQNGHVWDLVACSALCLTLSSWTLAFPQWVTVYPHQEERRGT